MRLPRGKRVTCKTRVTLSLSFLFSRPEVARVKQDADDTDFLSSFHRRIGSSVTITANKRERNETNQGLTGDIENNGRAG